VVLFIEYIPVMSGPEKTDNDALVQSDHFLMLTEQERKEFRSQVLNYRNTKPIYVVHSPGDEELFGGCVSAGRGFAHVTPSGDLTACPVSNVATHNLKTATLREGFASQLFTKIRENESLLENEGTPCSLFAHPKEVAELAESVNAYRTDQ
jgi:MoaA/NifB/PqqE/SkfB family radical SAM enzyme